MTTFNVQREHLLDDLRVGFGENSWSLNLPLSSCRNLFEGAETAFRVQAFICKCGEERISVTNEIHTKLQYICLKCENSQFPSTERMTNKYGDLLVNIKNDAEFSIEKGYAYAKVYIDIPTNIDLSANKVLFDKKLIYTLRIDLDRGDESLNEIYTVSSDVMQVVHNALIHHIDTHYLVHKLKNYTLLGEKRATPTQHRKTVKFFLEYPLFYDAVFLLWEMDKELYLNGGETKTDKNLLAYLSNYRSEKSVKKSLYKRYMNEIESGKFKPLTPYIICRTFTDPNLICRLLDNHDLLFTDCAFESIKSLASPHIELLEFLKKYFTQKALTNAFTHTSIDVSLWEDSVSMYDNTDKTEGLISEYFRKPRSNIKAIHDELVRAGRYRDYEPQELELNYSKEVEKPCVLWHDSLEIKLPKTTTELFEWSNTLDNCIYGYVSSVYAGETIIYGVYKEKELTYVIEIQNGKNIQMEGKHNTKIENKDNRSLLAWYKKFFQKTSPILSNNGETPLSLRK